MMKEMKEILVELEEFKSRLEKLEKVFQNNMSDHWKLFSDLVLDYSVLKDRVMDDEE